MKAGYKLARSQTIVLVPAGAVGLVLELYDHAPKNYSGRGIRRTANRE
jgi:hypothetical protein